MTDREREIEAMKIKIYKDHGLLVITELEYASYKKETGFFIHTEVGKKALEKNGYYTPSEILKRIGAAFNHFQCGGCQYAPYDVGKEVCKICHVVKTILSLF